MQWLNKYSVVTGVMALMFAAILSSATVAQQGTSAANCVVTTAAPSYTNGTIRGVSCDTSGNTRVTGTITVTPSGTQNVNVTQTNSNALVNDAAAAGTTAPLPVGGIYNDTLPTYTNGQRTQLQGNARGALISGEQDALVASGSCAATCNGTTLVSFDLGGNTGFKTVTYQLTTAGSGTVTMQQSNDNSTWVAFNCMQPGVQRAPLVSSTNGSFAGIQVCTTNARYWRAQFTAYTSGTFSATAYARSAPTGPLPVQGVVGTFPFPMDATLGTAAAVFVTNSATGTTGATAATLSGVSSKTTYLCGFSVRANATAAATGNIAVTGTISGTLNFTQHTQALASGVGVTEPNIGPWCIPASAQNTSIVVTSAAPGAGGTVSVTAWGFQL